jgi:hypothetical protein
VSTAAISAIAVRSEPSEQLQQLLKTQRILGTFGNWMVDDGQTAAGLKFCDATSLTQGKGGRVSFRALSNSAPVVEWRVLPSQTAPGDGLTDAEAKRLLVAEFAPPFMPEAGGPTMPAVVRVGIRTEFPVTFTLIRVGSSAVQRGRYWWLVELENFENLGRLSNWALNEPEMWIGIAEPDIPVMKVSMSGFSAALREMMRCSREPPNPQ